MRWLLASLGALVFFVAAPVAAEPASAPEAIPPEVLAPNEEARQFFEAIEANPLSGERVAEIPAERMAPLDSLMTAAFARGERVPDWQTLGVDVRAAASERDGGLASNMLESTNEFGLERTYFGDLTFESVVPAGFRLVARAGEEVGGDNVDVQIGHVSPKAILVMRIELEGRGRMECERRSDIRIYADPGVSASQMDVIAVMVVLRTYFMPNRPLLCYGALEQRPGQYVVRAFDSEGYRIPGAEDDARPFRIVPRAPFPASTGPR